MKPRLRWLLCAGCALILGLEGPAALAVLRGPPPTVRPTEGDLDARVPEPSGLDALDHGCLELPRG